MKRAISLASAGIQANDGGPFGAVIVRDGKIIGEGWNRVLATNDVTAHGEVVAIRDACEKQGSPFLDGCEIYTTGQPCPMCLGAIQWARISAIYYGFSIEDTAEMGFGDYDFFQQHALPPAEREIVEKELGREIALDLMEEYLSLPDRRLY